MVVRDQQPERVTNHGLSVCRSSERELHHQSRSPSLRSYSDCETSTKLCCPLSHRQQPNTNTAVRIQTYAVVLDSQCQPVSGLQVDLAGPRSRMPGNVGDCFFRNPVNRDFDGSRKNREFRLSGHRDGQRCVPRLLTLGRMNVAHLVSSCSLPESTNQPQLVERRRAESVDQATDVCYCGPQLGP